MTRKQKYWASPEIENLLQLMRAGMKDRAIVDKIAADTGYRYTPAQINSIRQRYYVGGQKMPAERPPKEEPFHVAYEIKPLQLSGDYMIVGDVHVPTTDYRLAQLVARVGKKHLTNPRLIIGGDFFNFDAFSNYPAVVPSYSWREERKAAECLLSEWLETFTDIVIIMGNHDRRIQRWSMGALEESDIFGMVVSSPKVKVSNVGWLTVTTSQGVYRVTHARNYSVNRLTVADQLAQKFQQNIIQFHEHHLGLSFDKFGRWLIVNGGGLFDPSQMVYARLDDNKSPAMVPGFVMLKNGVPHLFGDRLTDWAEWL